MAGEINREQPSQRISFASVRLGSHVRAALVLASQFAARAELKLGGMSVTRTGPTRPMEAFDLLYAVSAVAQSGQAPSGDDSAFVALNRILETPKVPQFAMSGGDKQPFDEPLNFDYAESLAQSLGMMLALKREGSQTSTPVIWGRDLVTACLLTTMDQSLQRFAMWHGTSLADLQDDWHGFLMRGKDRAPSSWDRWWRLAGVPLPAERHRRPAIDTGWHSLASGYPPAWASEWGQDGHGVFVGFTVGDVTQRLRWIPPGRFVMGSPEDEAGRWDDEGPQHAVTLAEGFWLFDTPVTQALWVAVMGDNPSRFRSPERPVEQVSFDDVQGFLGRVNELLPDLSLRLPSEAQWEYACRAGTETAVWTGPLEILGEKNAPGLDPIAWYGGNSGQGFELEEGEDSSRWPEKQHPHTKAGTRPVGLKAANPWGLYDMLGNVWEWCADDWHGSYVGAPTDGRAWLTGGSESGERDRVVRGGSWVVDARIVRAANRNWYHQSDRYVNLGFRCARGQV